MNKKETKLSDAVCSYCNNEYTKEDPEYGGPYDWYDTPCCFGCWIEREMYEDERRSKIAMNSCDMFC